jgi:hypothetical protein
MTSRRNRPHPAPQRYCRGVVPPWVRPSPTSHGPAPVECQIAHTRAAGRGLPRHRASSSLVFASLMRCSDRWNRVLVSDLERQQLRLFRQPSLALDPEPRPKPSTTTDRKRRVAGKCEPRVQATALQGAQDLTGPAKAQPSRPTPVGSGPASRSPSATRGWSRNRFRCTRPWLAG